jgi:RHS repeat-associated protein
VLFVDTAGATSGLTHYDPYGVARRGSTSAVRIGYAGEYRDATGLINLRARSYDPVLGRFIGRDTFGGVASAPQTGNRYAYATANPLRFTDPSGHFVQTVIDNPYTVLEIAMTFHPVGALLVFGYQLATGTDPATGEPADPMFAALGVASVALGPVARLVKIGGGALVKGLGHTIGAGITKGFAAERALVRGASPLGARAGTRLDRVLTTLGDRLGGKAINRAVAGIKVSDNPLAIAGSRLPAIRGPTPFGMDPGT